ncbi:MAG: exodeoxyribonuclease VII small subunit [Thermoplasmata archaeon]|nr:exodeoxyribonuclease VII small subunit [Thermoplasmata archaeon]
MNEEKKPEEMSFEESLEELNRMVDLLEKGDLDLDQSIEIYEKAVVLRDRCRSILEDSERRVEKLIETAEGIKKEDLILQ